MSAFILALMSATRTGDGISCVDRALTLSQIPEEKHSRVALLAGDNDIPGPKLGVDGHGELLPVGDCEN